MPIRYRATTGLRGPTLRAVMPLVELILGIIKPSSRIGALLAAAGVLLCIAGVAYMPIAIVAVQTHIGPPSLTTFAAYAFWPGIAAIVLVLMHRKLPKLLQRVGQYFTVGRRQQALCIGAVAAVGGSTLWAWMYPKVRSLQALPPLLLVPSIVLLGAVLSCRMAEAEHQRRLDEARREGDDLEIVPSWAGTLANCIVAGLAVSTALLVWVMMLRLPMGAGGIREKCVQIDVSTAGMPMPARVALVGTDAARQESPGREMTLPARILRKDGREAFLWMSTGQGVTVPLEQIHTIIDYDESKNGCGGKGPGYEPRKE